MGTRETVEREVNVAMQSGLYSVASLEMFDILEQLEPTDNLLSHLEYTKELLNEYFNELMEFKDERPGLIEFLKAIKTRDMSDNQSIEKEHPFLIDLYSQMPVETAMDKLIKYAKNGKIMTDKNILLLHSTLLYGTLSDNEEKIRNRNDKFVGRVVNGERMIDYFPIDYKDIREALKKLAELYNCRLSGDVYDNVFFQPFLIHGLYGALQLFNDGNTRMGRIMQHSLMWQLINERTDYDFDLPPIYATRSYYPLRCKYRELIAMLVKENNAEAWNKWFDFNLDRVEDSIYAGRENVMALRRKIEFNKRQF